MARDSHLTLSWILSHPLVGAAAVSSAGAGLVHAAASGTHSAERVAAVLFAITGALQVAWAFYYVARPTRTAATIGFALNSVFAAMWLVSRTIGLPMPEALAGVEHASLQDGIAAALGLIAAVCAALAVWRADKVQKHRAGSLASAAAISLVVVGLAVAGISAPHGHGAASSSHEGMAMAPAAPGPTPPGSMPGMEMGSMPGMDMGTPQPTTSQGVTAGGLTSADIRFAQMTVARRTQIVRMADLALTNATNPDVLALANLIKADTATDVYRMADALRAAKQPVPDPVAHAASTTPDAVATALVSEADLVKLENAYGESFDSVFLGLLVRQHDRAMASAGQLLGSGGSPTTRPVARAVIVSSASQRTAIEELKESMHRDK